MVLAFHGSGVYDSSVYYVARALPERPSFKKAAHDLGAARF